MFYYNEDSNAYDELYSEVYEELCEIMSPNDTEFYKLLEDTIEARLEESKQHTDEVIPF